MFDTDAPLDKAVEELHPSISKGSSLGLTAQNRPLRGAGKDMLRLLPGSLPCEAPLTG